MKRLFKISLSIIFATITSTTFFAQAPQRVLDPSNMREGEDVEYCVQHKKMIELLKNPEKLKMFQAEQAQLKAEEQNLSETRDANGRATLLKIPIVFHVLHNGGLENISREQILGALEIMNQDFRMLNADVNNVNATFLGMPIDSDIEFVLATKAPDGTCFSGITRTNSGMTFNGDNGGQQVQAIINGNDVYNGSWPGNSYLNIFIAADIGGAAGYTTYPSNWSATNMTNGIWVLHNYVGSIGTGSPNRSRTLTHEAGHWLNLPHTWGSNNNPGNASSCSDDDGVADTPRCIGLTSCNLNANTCSNDAVDGYWTVDVNDNTENYMEYSYCSKMFTPGQVNRMRTALQSNVGQRNNLHTTANLNFTGTNGTAPLCRAEFNSDRQVICEGQTITFTDESFHNVSGRTWSFTGGSPATSTSQNPSVTYTNPGTYTVSLQATDGSNTVTETKTSYITVLPSEGRGLSIVEGFESITVPNSEWFINNPNQGTTFGVTSAAAATGSKSLMIPKTNNNAGDVDELISSTIDLSNVGGLELSFKYAFAKQNTNNDDYLRILTSNDCGETWSVRRNISATAIATANNTTGNFVPSASEWETITVTNITSNFWVENFRFKILYSNGGGNNLYIDDINIFDPTDPSASIMDNQRLDAFKLYPNPSNDNTNLLINISDNSETNIFITDMIGKVVNHVQRGILTQGEHNFNINVSDLSKGVYFVNVNVDGKVSTKKLIVE
jgi:PKD repeat protein